MSLDLDDNTLTLLGYGTTDDREEHLFPTRLGGRVSRTPTGEVDGRSHRNWRHKRESRATPQDAARPHQETPHQESDRAVSVAPQEQHER